MKRILLSLLIIFLAAIGVIGATQAYFTEQEVLGVNTLTAGKVDIDLRGDGVHSVLLGTSSGLAPGIYGPGLFHLEIYNQAGGVSTLPVKYRMTSQYVGESEPGYWDLIWVKVHHTNAGTANPASWPVVYQGLLKNLNLNSVDNAIADYLDPNITHVYYFEYGLDSTAGNEYQGANAQFNLIVDATQTNNPGWTE